MEKLLLYRQWRIHFDRGDNLSGLRVRTAVVPSFNLWIDHPRRWGMSFHLTQILTGHGCFADYLFRIGRETTDICFHCGNACDTAQHTLEVCDSWCIERTELCEIVGYNLALPSLVEAMLDSENNWKAVVQFANGWVMLQKEEAERVRREAAIAEFEANDDVASDSMSIVTSSS